MATQEFYTPGDRSVKVGFIEELESERKKLKEAFQGVEDRFSSTDPGVPDYTNSADKIDASFPDGNPAVSFPGSQTRRIRITIRKLDGGILTFHPTNTCARMAVQSFSGAASIAPQESVKVFVNGVVDFDVVYIGTLFSVSAQFAVLVIGAPWLIVHPVVTAP